MSDHAVLFQSPRPEVIIWRPDRSEKICFDLLNKTLLQSYTFSTSINDEKGKFSLIFYPDDVIFDQINIMDIVEICESQSSSDFDSKSNKHLPSFVGIIREKKYVFQKTDSGVNRKIHITGHSIAGLVHEFKINLDIRAMTITKQIANGEVLRNELTTKFTRANNKTLTVKYVISEIWKTFLNVSCKYDKLSTPEIAKYIEQWIGNEEKLFDVDDSSFYYPLASIFHGQSTQTFFNIIADIIPKPVYEIFPITYSGKANGKNGESRLVIRECPFDEDKWKNLHCVPIDTKTIKSFDVKQSDDEVYTVFFSYLRGSAIQEDRAIILAAQNANAHPGLVYDEKYGKYGYRPLLVSFNGYGIKDGTTDTDTVGRLNKMNERLQKWYSNKDVMLSGSITMGTNLKEYSKNPQVGEKISFLGGEFYVIDCEHSWNYGGTSETKITFDRGGAYDSNGVFSKLENLTKRYQEFEEYKNAS